MSNVTRQSSRRQGLNSNPAQATGLWLAISIVSLVGITNSIIAADPQRQIHLPATPYKYTDNQWPPHFQPFIKTYDNTPSDNPITNHGVTLGRVLFYDTALSANGTTSCASCHKQKLAFTDDRTVSTGFAGRQVTRNSMSLVNSRFYPRGRFFWDERAATLEEQVLMPIENEIEMGHSLAKLIPILQTDPIYKPLFKNAFGDPQVTQQRVAHALAQFVRSIVSYRSKYDAGRAMVKSVTDPFPNFTQQQNYGKDQFFGRARCAECHLPDSLKDQPTHQNGLVKNGRQNKAPMATRQSAFFFLDRPLVNGVDTDPTDHDGGVGEISKQPKDVGRFKIPSLRNIEITGPYMHDGRFTTLDQVVEYYNWSVGPHPNLDTRLQDFSANGLALPEREKVALTEFLRTLTDHKLINDPKFSDPFRQGEPATAK